MKVFQSIGPTKSCISGLYNEFDIFNVLYSISKLFYVYFSFTNFRLEFSIVKT